MSSNGDAPVQYVITQGPERRWVVRLSGPDEDASKLAAFVKDHEIEGEILVTIEFRMVDSNGDDQLHQVGPMTIQTGELR